MLVTPATQTAWLFITHHVLHHTCHVDQSASSLHDASSQQQFDSKVYAHRTQYCYVRLVYVHTDLITLICLLQCQ